MSPPPLVSIVLCTRDGAGTLPAVLRAIRAQRALFPFEIVAVDSGSEDATMTLLREQVDRLVEIEPAEFNHGSTRNVAVEAARGEFVVLLVQDAEPDSTLWLANLVGPLLADQTLAGTYARQVPRDDASIVTREYLLRYAGASPEPRTQALSSHADFSDLTAPQKLALCTFDNVCSCIRRAVWRDHPFRATPIAEDVEWAKDVLLAGYRLAYVPDAVVRHSHERGSHYELMRTYLVHQRLGVLLGLRTVPSLGHLVHSIGTTAVAHLRWLAGDRTGSGRNLREIPRALALAVAFPLGQYLGGKSAATGRDYLRARGI